MARFRSRITYLRSIGVVFQFFVAVVCVLLLFFVVLDV